MKKFSVRKISALVLVFCLFVSVFANTGIYTARAADEVADGTALVSGADADIVVEDVADASAASSTDAPAAPAAPAASATDAPAVSSTDAPAAPAASSTDAEGKPQIADTEKVEREPVMMVFAAEAAGTTTSITVDYQGAGTAWLKVNSVYADADTWLADCGFDAPGSDSYVTATQSGNTYTLTFDSSVVGAVWVTVNTWNSATSTGGNWSSLIAGSIVLYDAEDGTPTTEKPEVTTNIVTAVVTYGGDLANCALNSTSATLVDGTAVTYDKIDGWGSNDYMSMTGDGNGSYTVTWDANEVETVDVILYAATENWYPSYSLNLTLNAGDNLTYYTKTDGTFTTVKPNPVSATLTYAGEQTSSYSKVIGVVLADGTEVETTLEAWQNSNEYVAIATNGTSWTISWDANDVASVKAEIGGYDGTDYNPFYATQVTLTGGEDYTYVDDAVNGTLVQKTDDSSDEEEEDTTKTITVTYHGDGDVWFKVNSVYKDESTWLSDDVTAYATVVDNGDKSFSVTFDTTEVGAIWVDVDTWNSTTSTGGEFNQLITDSVDLYDAEDGSLTTEKPEDDSTEEKIVSASISCVGDLYGYYVNAIKATLADGSEVSFKLEAWQGSNEYVSFAQNGNSWTLTWDANAVTSIVAEVGGFAEGYWPAWSTTVTLYGGENKTYTEDENANGGAMVEYVPEDTTVGTATITYMGTGSNWWMGTDGAYGLTEEEWYGGWLQAPGSNDYITITLTDNVYTLTWDTTVVTGAYAKFGNSVGSWEGKIFTGDNIVIYDDENGLTTEAPIVSAGIRYLGTAGNPILVVESYVDTDGNLVEVGWVAESNGTFTFSGDAKSISWNENDIQSVNVIVAGVIGENYSWVQSLKLTLTAGDVIDIYDNEDYTDFTTEATELEVPSNYVSATVVYMGTHGLDLGSYGLSPVDSIAPAYGWWINDSAAPNAPIGEYTMCSVSGNTYTFMWDGDLAKQCWIWYNSSYYNWGTYTSLEPGEVVYIYDKDILGRLAYVGPTYSTSTVEIYTDDVNWSGISALCTTDGEWINGLWIDSNSNDYGITVTKTVLDGKTVYTYTFDRTQISTICVESGVVNNDGIDSKIWINFINGRTRKLYVDEATGNITTFPAGYTYVKPGAGEGIDGTLKIHYIREDGDYSSWYFGYWYELSGEWFSYNQKFDSEGVYALDLIDIPANEIGFVVNYNEWESKDIEEDRFIQLSKLVADENGEYNVYLYSGDATVYYEPKA